MGEPEYIYIAAKMLECDPHQMGVEHPDIYKELNTINALCEKAGGVLRSRQIIALVILSWQDVN